MAGKANTAKQQQAPKVNLDAIANQFDSITQAVALVLMAQAEDQVIISFNFTVRPKQIESSKGSHKGTTRPLTDDDRQRAAALFATLQGMGVPVPSMAAE